MVSPARLSTPINCSHPCCNKPPMLDHLLTFPLSPQSSPLCSGPPSAKTLRPPRPVRARIRNCQYWPRAIGPTKAPRPTAVAARHRPAPACLAQQAESTVAPPRGGRVGTPGPDTCRRIAGRPLASGLGGTLGCGECEMEASATRAALASILPRGEAFPGPGRATRLQLHQAITRLGPFAEELGLSTNLPGIYAND